VRSLIDTTLDEQHPGSAATRGWGVIAGDADVDATKNIDDRDHANVDHRGACSGAATAPALRLLGSDDVS
jgi:hypothetical protein